MTPAKIHAKCLECCDGNADAVRGCFINGCKRWPQRMGQIPTDPPRTQPAQRQRLETQDLRLTAFSERDPDQCGRWLILAADEIDRLRAIVRRRWCASGSRKSLESYEAAEAARAAGGDRG